MKRFDQIISPMSWVVIYFGFIPLFFVIFHPSLNEFAIFLGVDFLGLLIVRPLEWRVFLRCYPDSAGFFPDNAFEPTNLSEPQAGLKLFDAMVRFPRRRALFVTLANFPKAIPGALVAILYWQYDYPWWEQLLKLFALVSFIWSYFYAVVYIDNHRLISDRIAAFHQRYDWKHVFEKATYPFGRCDFKIQETVAVLSICGFAVLLHWLVGNERTPAGIGTLRLPQSLITFASIALISRIWYLEKLYFVGGIEALFRGLESSDPEQETRVLPLRSTTLLGQFGRVFNAREARIAAYRRELAVLLQYQVEESRYQAINELSALTLHDIAAPLQVIQFLTEQIDESPDCVKDPEYRKQLSENVKKAVSLLQSLRTHTNESGSTEASAAFAVSREHTWQLLAASFTGSEMQKIDWDIDERLLPLQLRITNADLIHVLFSLLKNSAQNLLQHGIAYPRVTIQLEALTPESVKISIADNGTGLTPERFEELTALASSHSRLRQAMDLRFTRRVVERNGGSLEVLPVLQGTVFQLTLRLASKGATPETRFASQIAEMHGWRSRGDN